MKKRVLSLILVIAILFTACGTNTAKVEQKNNSFSAYLLVWDDEQLYAKTNKLFKENFADIDLTLDVFIGTGFSLLNSRERWQSNTEELQEYYNNIINNLRKDEAGDLVEGDTLYIDWPGVTPIDWHKLIQTGVFANVEDYATDDMKWLMEGRLSNDFYHNGKLCMIPLEYNSLHFYSTKSICEKYNFNFFDDMNNTKTNDILTFLEKCAEWVKEYGDDDNTPSIMPDYDYQRLKTLILDVCGIEVVDYETGKVTFDDPIIKRILEAMKIIGEDIENSYLEDQATWEYEEDACKAERYLLCDGYVLEEDYISQYPYMISENSLCSYVTKWLAVPSTSTNQSIAYEYIKILQDPDKEKRERNHGWYEEYEHLISMNLPKEDNSLTWGDIALPSAWQYALSDLFDEYYAGHINVDDFAKQVQGRLEIYITE